MANEEHLKQLRKGVASWNQWRIQHPEIRPDLRGACLKGDYLRGVYLFRADLSDANFSGANLYRADFREAYLTNADLTGTDLSGSDLSDAYLRGANLYRANLYRANLSEANVTNARVEETLFVNLDLRYVKGLEVLDHNGPSFISIDTFYLSKGQIPESFLRQTGVPEDFLAYLPSLMNKAIEYYTCFISYASKDENFARRLYADLQREGVRCWFAPEDLKIGDHYHQRIDESIRLYDKLILILSEQAVQSAWVEREVAAAREKEDQLGREVLFPIRLDEVVMHTTKAWAADVRRRWHIGDFTRWKYHDAYQQAFVGLLRDLRAQKQRTT